MEEAASESVLDLLPSECLMALLSLCDARTLGSVAQAHSTLREPATFFLHSRVSDGATGLKQQHVDSLMLWLTKHGQHVPSLDLSGTWKAAFLRQLPAQLQLHSLTLRYLQVQTQPGQGYRGVLCAGAPLRQLRLDRCTLLDGESALAAALEQLPHLKDLSLGGLQSTGRGSRPFPGLLLQKVPQLTRLELFWPQGGPLQNASSLQHLSTLTALQDLRAELCKGTGVEFTAEVLLPLSRLTCLSLDLNGASFEPRGLAGKTALQQLTLTGAALSGQADGVEELLLELHGMQQLEVLSLKESLTACTAHLEAYAALTASSGLRSLDLSSCMLPAGAWQHVWQQPSGVPRSLPLLQELRVSHLRGEQGFMSEADMRRLVSGLVRLQLWGPSRVSEAGLLALTQLTRLSELMVYSKGLAGWRDTLTFTGQGGDAVWRQVLQHCLNCSRPEVAHMARQAAAAAERWA